MTWDTVIAEAQMAPGQSAAGDVEAAVLPFLQGTGALAAKVLSNDLHVPAVCGGVQTLAGATVANDIAPVSNPLEGRTCGHSILIASVAAFGEHLGNSTGGTNRRLLQTEDGTRTAMETELRSRVTTWETLPRLRRSHTANDVLRYHTKDGYDLAPNDASHHPFGEVSSYRGGG